MADAQIAIIDGDQTQVVLAPGENPAIVTSIPGPQGPAGAGVPLGGTTNQVLFKQSGTNYDTAWGPITSAMIGDLEIVNADVAAAAAIAGTKISPNFGSQNVITTGTSTAASFIPTSSTVPTNGVYLPAANSVAISTNGTGRLFIDSSGSVGIGVTPVQKLHVDGSISLGDRSGTGSQYLGFTAFNGFGGGSGHIEFTRDGSSNTGIRFRLNGTEQFRFLSGTSTELMRLDNLGRLGVGTSSPSTQLHVTRTNSGVDSETVIIQNRADASGTTASIYFSTNTAGTGVERSAAIKAICPASSSTANDLAFYTNTTGNAPLERLRITSAGNVGIGTTVPSGLFHIRSAAGTTAAFYITTSATTDDSAIYFGDNNLSSSGRIIYDHDTDSMAFSTNLVERLRIDSSGRVGIGVTSPLFPLDVNGVIYTRGRGSTFGVLFDDWRIYNSTAPGALVFDNGSERARIDSSGRLLVGTSSAPQSFDGGTTIGAQIEHTGSSNKNLLRLVSNAVADWSPILSFARSRGTANGAVTPVASGDNLGNISWAGADGTGHVLAAQILAQVDGTPGTNDMPGRLVFSTTADGAASPTERMRITSNGDVLINTTSSDAFFDGTIRVEDSTTVSAFRCTGASGAIVQSVWHQATTGDNQLVSFGTEVARVTRGSITYNRGGGVVAYNTTSDYRSKTILGDVGNPGETIDALKVYRGVMNGATVERPMLVAHEAQEVAPYCVTGEKDAVDDEGNPIYQQMDHQVLVPLLIAEIQQLRARVAALESA